MATTPTSQTWNGGSARLRFPLGGLSEAPACPETADATPTLRTSSAALSPPSRGPRYILGLDRDSFLSHTPHLAHLEVLLSSPSKCINSTISHPIQGPMPGPLMATASYQALHPLPPACSLVSTQLLEGASSNKMDHVLPSRRTSRGSSFTQRTSQRPKTGLCAAPQSAPPS